MKGCRELKSSSRHFSPAGLEPQAAACRSCADLQSQGSSSCNLALRRVGHAGQHVGEPGQRIDVIELCSRNQRHHRRSTLGAPLRSGKQPRLAAQRKAAQRPLGSVVRQADPAIIHESRQTGPSAAACSRSAWRQMPSATGATAPPAATSPDPRPEARSAPAAPAGAPRRCGR